MSYPRIIELERGFDRLLTALIAKGVFTPGEADTITTGIPKHGPDSLTCCEGGPQWGHAWSCKTLP